MQKSKWPLFIGIIETCLAAGSVFAIGSDKTGTPVVPTPGLVTMLDPGADKCIPCKMMAPIIEELKKEYEGIAAFPDKKSLLKIFAKLGVAKEAAR